MIYKRTKKYRKDKILIINKIIYVSYDFFVLLYPRYIG